MTRLSPRHRRRRRRRRLRPPDRLSAAGSQTICSLSRSERRTTVLYRRCRRRRDHLAQGSEPRRRRRRRRWTLSSRQQSVQGLLRVSPSPMGYPRVRPDWSARAQPSLVPARRRRRRSLSQGHHARLRDRRRRPCRLLRRHRQQHPRTPARPERWHPQGSPRARRLPSGRARPTTLRQGRHLSAVALCLPRQHRRQARRRPRQPDSRRAKSASSSSRLCRASGQLAGSLLSSPHRRQRWGRRHGCLVASLTSMRRERWRREGEVAALRARLRLARSVLLARESRQGRLRPCPSVRQLRRGRQPPLHGDVRGSLPPPPRTLLRRRAPVVTRLCDRSNDGVFVSHAAKGEGSVQGRSLRRRKAAPSMPSRERDALVCAGLWIEWRGGQGLVRVGPAARAV